MHFSSGRSEMLNKPLQEATIFSCFVLVILAWLGGFFNNDAGSNVTDCNSALMKQLIEDSTSGEMLMYSDALEKNRVAEAEVPGFVNYINNHLDHTSYHLL